MVFAAVEETEVLVGRSVVVLATVVLLLLLGLLLLLVLLLLLLLLRTVVLLLLRRTVLLVRRVVLGSVVLVDVLSTATAIVVAGLAATAGATLVAAGTGAAGTRPNAWSQPSTFAVWGTEQYLWTEMPAVQARHSAVGLSQQDRAGAGCCTPKRFNSACGLQASEAWTDCAGSCGAACCREGCTWGILTCKRSLAASAEAPTAKRRSADPSMASLHPTLHLEGSAGTLEPVDFWESTSSPGSAPESRDSWIWRLSLESVGITVLPGGDRAPEDADSTSLGEESPRSKLAFLH